MKHLFTILLLAGTCASAMAQTADVAVAISESLYEGTARTASMGNAFTSLGGDLGAITLNPAGSAVMRHSEFSITPGLNIAGASSEYLGNTTSASNIRFTIPSAGFVWNLDTGRYSGLLNFTFGVVYNTRNNFNAYSEASGTSNESTMLAAIAENLSYDGIPYYDLEKDGSYDPYKNSMLGWPEILAWNTYGLATVSPQVDDEYISSTENMSGSMIYVADDVKQKYNHHVYGGTSEIALNFGANISDILFLGINFNFTSVRYEVEDNYLEASYDPSAFEDGFVSMQLNSWQRTSGAGFDVKFGAILSPLKGLRIGATVSTPTWYRLTDTWDQYMTTEFNNGKRFTESSPVGSYSYKLTSPFRFSLGASYVFGTRGLVSFDYERVDYASTTLKDAENSLSQEIDLQNSLIKDVCGVSNILRAGAEFWIVPSFAIRGGYSYYEASSQYTSKHQFASIGAGFKLSENSSLDLAWQHKLPETEYFQLYTINNPDCSIKVPQGTSNPKGDKIFLTYTFRF